MTTRYRYRFAGLALSALMAVAACSSSSSQSPGANDQGSSAGPVTLHALFMKQAGYSDDDVTAMDDAFMAANPGIKVAPEFVAVRGAARQDRHRPGRRLRHLRRRPHGYALAGRIRQGRDRDRHDVEDPGRFQDRHLRLGVDRGHLPGQVLRRAVDQRHQVLLLQQEDAREGRLHQRRRRPGTSCSPRPRPSRPRASSSIRSMAAGSRPNSVICDWADAGRRLGGASFIDAKGNAAFNTGGGPLAALQLMKSDDRRSGSCQSRVARLRLAMTCATCWSPAGGVHARLDLRLRRLQRPGTVEGRRPGRVMATPRRGQHRDGRCQRRDEPRDHHAPASTPTRPWRTTCSSPARRAGEVHDNAFPDVEGVLRQRRRHQRPTWLLRPRPRPRSRTMVARPMVPYYTALSTPFRSPSRRRSAGRKTPQAGAKTRSPSIPAPEPASRPIHLSHSLSGGAARRSRLRSRQWPKVACAGR